MADDITTVLHPEQQFDVSQTVVWSPLFQATWDAMNLEFGGKPFKVDPPNETMKLLDEFQWKPGEVMPETGWKVWSGEATEEFLGVVNREAAVIAGEERGPFELGAANPGTIACFGLLDRSVEFEKEFHEAKKQALQFGREDQKEPVAFFGVRGELSGRYGKSVKVLSYAEKSFALEISCSGTNEAVVLYLPPEPMNFRMACESVRKMRNDFSEGKNPDASVSLGKDDPYLHAGDDVRVPYVSLAKNEDFVSSLSGGRFYGKQGDPWMIVRALQVTKFELFEKGAKVRVETSIGIDPFGGPPPPIPRTFIYNRPFFVFLWRSDSDWPYFGAWIADASALRKF